MNLVHFNFICANSHTSALLYAIFSINMVISVFTLKIPTCAFKIPGSCTYLTKLINRKVCNVGKFMQSIVTVLIMKKRKGKGY